MAAPSGIVWGAIKGSYGRIGIYTSISNVDLKSTVTIQVWFWSKYSVSDSNNRFRFDNNATSATTVLDDVTIKTTVDSGDGWSTSNQVQIGTFSYSYDRTSIAKTIYCASALSGIDAVGTVTMTVSTSYTIPALPVYTITYNANGGTGAPSSQSKVHGSTIKIPSTIPTRSGYTFLGWNSSSTATTATYSAGGDFTANLNTTLYAVWRANSFTVSYNANGGTGAPSSQTKTYGVALTLSSTVPTRTDYKFLGWGVSANSTTASYAAGGSYTTDASITLYAVWELDYTRPRITGVTVTRCNSSGTAADDGTYFKAVFGWATDKTVSSISVRWKTTTATTWTSSAVTASGTTGSVSQIFGAGAISTDYAYNVIIVVSDSSGNTSVSRSVPGNAYAIDFKSGGTGVAIGKVADTANLFDVNLPTRLRNTLTVNGAVTVPSVTASGTSTLTTLKSTTANLTTATINTLYDNSGQKITNGLAVYESAGIDPDTTLDHLILTNANTPNGAFMYIKTEFYSSKTTTSNRMQTAYPYYSSTMIYTRYYYNGAWSEWSVIGSKMYSTAETKTGDVWIDGKPIYKRVLQATFDNVTEANSYTIGTISNFETPVSVRGFMKQESTYWWALPYSRYNSIQWSISLGFSQAGVLYLWKGSYGTLSDVYAIVEYTKTTD